MREHGAGNLKTNHTLSSLVSMMMWKPGTAKPPSSSTGNAALPLPPNSGKPITATNQASLSKKLSTATMGMRFMKRKNNNDTNNNSNKIVDERRAVSAPAVTNARQIIDTKGSHDTTTTNIDDTRNNTHNNNSNGSSDANIRKRAIDEMMTTTKLQQQQTSTSNYGGQVIIELASVVDMYGTGSDIIGRRSFGGFHKSSMTTYDTALKRRADDSRTRNTNSHITDEELLKRYEKYVDNDGGVRDSGNRGGGGGRSGRKEKRKRN